MKYWLLRLFFRSKMDALQRIADRHGRASTSVSFGPFEFILTCERKS